MSLKDHACVRIDGQDIPLIGVPPRAGMERCDRCGRWKPIQQVQLVIDDLVCLDCLGQLTPPQERS